MAYLLFRKRPNASQSFNNFRISSIIAEKCEGDRDQAEKMLAKTYYRSISTAAANNNGKTVVPILPPSGDKLWSWNRSFEIACSVASQWCDNEIPLLVPEEANIFIGTEVLDMDEDEKHDLLDELDFAFDKQDGKTDEQDEDGNASAFDKVLADADKKPKWLVGFGGDLEQMMKKDPADVLTDTDADPDIPAEEDGWKKEAEDVEAVIAGVENTFADWLSEQLKERKMSSAALARAANMLQSTVVRLAKGIIVVPTKSQILAIGCALGLPRDEIDHMLSLSGYALSPNVPRDMVVAYYIDNGIYDIGRINRALFLHGIPTLGTHRAMPR